MYSAPRTSGWAFWWLTAAGVYNLVWGAVVIAWPTLAFDLAGMEHPTYPEIWQCVGMIVGVYGIGYLAAACDHRRHWPIILVGLLGKLFGPFGMAVAVSRGELPAAFALTCLTNDVIWWIPFTLMLRDAARHARNSDRRLMRELAPTFNAVHDQHGRSLRAISDDRPALVVLTRHAGCTFCKEMLADLERQRDAIDAAGLALVIVSMSDAETVAALAARHDLPGAHWISDPDQSLYAALELRRAVWYELLHPRLLWRGIRSTLRGHVQTHVDGDAFQLSGAFIVDKGEVTRAFRQRSAADRLDHQAFACELPAS